MPKSNLSTYFFHVIFVIFTRLLYFSFDEFAYIHCHTWLTGTLLVYVRKQVTRFRIVTDVQIPGSIIHQKKHLYL